MTSIGWSTPRGGGQAVAMLSQGGDEILPAFIGHVEVGIGGLVRLFEQIRGENPHDLVPGYVGTGNLVDVKDAIVGGVLAEAQEFSQRLLLPGGQGQAQLVADDGLPPQEVSLLDPEDDLVQHLAKVPIVLRIQVLEQVGGRYVVVEVPQALQACGSDWSLRSRRAMLFLPGHETRLTTDSEKTQDSLRLRAMTSQPLLRHPGQVQRHLAVGPLEGV